MACVLHINKFQQTYPINYGNILQEINKECMVTPCMAIPWPNKNFSTNALEEVMIHRKVGDTGFLHLQIQTHATVICEGH